MVCLDNLGEYYPGSTPSLALYYHFLPLWATPYCYYVLQKVVHYK